MGTTTEKLTYLQGTKDAIKNAIVAKGVEVPEGTTFRGYAEKVGEIQVGGEILSATITLENELGKDGSLYLYFVTEDGRKVEMSGNSIKNEKIKFGSPILLYYEFRDMVGSDTLINDKNENIKMFAIGVAQFIAYYPITEESIKIKLYRNL